MSVLLLVCCARVSGQRYTAQEIGVFHVLNELRGDPAGYVTSLEAQRRLYRGNLLTLPGQTPIQTEEGVRALDEAVAALRSVRGSLGALSLSPGLSHAAAEHVRDTGSRGLVGHESANGGGFSQRVSRFGAWSGGVGESITYGDADPRGVVSQMLIDDGVRDRGHRRNLLDPKWRYVGISCGAHSVYRGMCVLDFAVGFQDK
jgi:uncharacterized protein YkwD